MANYSMIKRVRQVDVTEEMAPFPAHDYADAFEVRLPNADTETPASWVLRGLTDTPILVKKIAQFLGRDEKTDPSLPDVVAGWHILQSTPQLIVLERTLPLMHVRAVGRNMGESDRRFTSVLNFRRPIIARALWTVIGPGHRRMSRRLVAGTTLAHTPR